MMFVCFFFNDTATTEIYTLSLHDALPIWNDPLEAIEVAGSRRWLLRSYLVKGLQRPREERWLIPPIVTERSEEHTSELQSRQYLVCRLLLEKKKKNKYLLDFFTFTNTIIL